MRINEDVLKPHYVQHIQVFGGIAHVFQFVESLLWAAKLCT